MVSFDSNDDRLAKPWKIFHCPQNKPASSNPIPHETSAMLTKSFHFSLSSPILFTFADKIWNELLKERKVGMVEKDTRTREREKVQKIKLKCKCFSKSVCIVMLFQQRWHWLGWLSSDRPQIFTKKGRQDGQFFFFQVKWIKKAQERLSW